MILGLAAVPCHSFGHHVVNRILIKFLLWPKNPSSFGPFPTGFGLRGVQQDRGQVCHLLDMSTVEEVSPPAIYKIEPVPFAAEGKPPLAGQNDIIGRLCTDIYAVAGMSIVSSSSSSSS